MKIYHIFWKETHIGTLYAENGKHKYDVDEVAISTLKNEPMNPILERSKDWGDEIPFFKTRLEANERFEGLEIGFLTDFVRFKEVVV